MGRLPKGEVRMTNDERKAARIEYNRRYYKKSGRTSANKPLTQFTCECGGTYRDTEALKEAHLCTTKHSLWIEEQEILPLYVEAGRAQDISGARMCLDDFYKRKCLNSSIKREASLPKVRRALKLWIAERNNINIII